MTPFLPLHFPSVQKVVVLLWSGRVGNASTLEEDPLECLSLFLARQGCRLCCLSDLIEIGLGTNRVTSWFASLRNKNAVRINKIKSQFFQAGKVLVMFYSVRSKTL